MRGRHDFVTASFHNRFTGHQVRFLTLLESGADPRAGREGASTVRVEMRPAIPSTLPEVIVPRTRRNRLLRWFAAAVTVLAATVAVLGAAMTAVMLGIT